MKQLFKTFKPWDFLFIGIALVLSFTPLFITTFIYTDKVDAPVAIVKIALDPQNVALIGRSFSMRMVTLEKRLGTTKVTIQ